MQTGIATIAPMNTITTAGSGTCAPEGGSKRDVRIDTAKRELERSFEDMVREIQHLIAQMNDTELRLYLGESLFLNTVKYENDRLEAYIKRLSKK